MQNQPHEGDDDRRNKPNRRGLNLSLADRARGGRASAKQQKRDSSGRFAGAVRGGGGDKSARASRSGSAGSGTPPHGGNGQSQNQNQPQSQTGNGQQPPGQRVRGRAQERDELRNQEQASTDQHMRRNEGELHEDQDETGEESGDRNRMDRATRQHEDNLKRQM